MTPETVLDDLKDDLVASYFTSQADRPAGLTASALGVCHYQAGLLINGIPKPFELGDWFKSMRGVLLHEGIQARTGTWKAEDRASATILGVEISGAADATRDGILREYKTRTKSVCRSKQAHGPDPNEKMQVAFNAHARGCEQAFIIYLPIDGSWTDAVCLEIDIPEGMELVHTWLSEIIGEEQENLPRDPDPSWCKSFCSFYDPCRTGYDHMAHQITDPVITAKMRLYAEYRDEAKTWNLLKDGLREELTGHEGVAGGLRIWTDSAGRFQCRSVND